MTDFVWDFPLRLPRNAFSSREVARAGDVWRLCQDAATLASIESGWPPSRFRVEGVFFVVYRMTLVHGIETPYGTPLQATTWVSRLRRRTLSTREVRVHSGDELVAAATQEWVHVDATTFKPTRGEEATAAAFPAVDREPSVKLPEFVHEPGSCSTFEFTMWQTWADPLGHANHPAYVDWCDEAIAQRAASAGIDPTQLESVAERVHFRDSVLPGENVTLRTERAGVVGRDTVVFKHVLETERGQAAEATTMRRLSGTAGREWIALWD